MFKSLKRRGEKTKEKVEFKLKFHATKVPLSGWDKLVVSLIPLETGRVTYKTTRVGVKNGKCEWTDTIVEPVKVILDARTKEYEKKPYTFIVSTGSSRSGILGEVTFDVAQYATSNSTFELALPLKNCTAGTILHTSITCLTPRAASSRDLERVGTGERIQASLEDDEGLSITDEDDLNDSDQSDNHTSGSFASSTSFPASNSTALSKGANGSHNRLQKDGGSAPRRYSTEGLDPSTPRAGGQHGSGRSSSSQTSHSSSFKSGTERQDSGLGRHEKELERERVPQRTQSSQESGNKTSSILPVHNRTASTPTSNGSQDSSGKSSKDRKEWASQRSRAPENGVRTTSQSNLGGKDSIQADLAAAETTIEELRLETVAAHRQNRKLSIEIETLRQQLNAHVRDEAENGITMTTLTAERDRLKLELEQIKSSKLAIEDKERGEGDARRKFEGAERALRELREEIRYEKEENQNLSIQLRKTQDSNIELVMAIKDLEESLDQQRKETDELSNLNNELEVHLGGQRQEASTQKEEEWKAQIGRLEKDKSLLEAQVLSLEGAQRSARTDDAHVQKLEKMIEQLTRDVEELEKESKELADENVELYINVEGMKKEVESKTARVAQLEVEAKNISEPPLNAQAIAKESSELLKLRDVVKDFERKLSASEDAQGIQLKRNKGHVEAIQTLVEELRTANAQLEKRLKAAEETASSATVQLQRANLQLESVQSERDGFAKQRKELEARFAEDREALEGRLAETKEAVAAREQEIRSMEESVHRSEEERSIALDKVVGLEDDIARLKSETRSIVEAKSSGENLARKLQMQKEEVEELKRNAEMECVRMGQQLQQRVAEITQLHQQLATHVAKSAEIESKVAELERQKSVLERSVQDSMETERLSKSRIEELLSQISAIAGERDSVTLLKHEIENHVLRVEAEKNELQREKNDLETKFQSLEEEGKAGKNRVELLEAECVSLQAQIETQTSSRRNLERRASELESTKDELYNQLTDLEEENLKHTERISGLEAQLRFVTEEREMHRLEREILEVRSLEHDSEKAKFEASLQVAAKDYQQKISELEAKVAELTVERKRHESSKIEFQRHVERLQQDSAGHLETVKALGDRIHNLETIKSGLESNLQQMSENYSLASKAVASMEAEMFALRAGKKETEDKFLIDLEALKQSTSDMEQRANHAEDALKSSRLEKAAAVERLQVEVQRLTEQMGSTNDQKERLASEALVEASELRAEKGEWEERLRQSEERVTQAQRDCSSVKAELGSRLQDLVNQTESSKSREQEMAFKLSETLRDFGDLKAKEMDSRSHAEDVDRKLALVLSEKESLEEELDELKMRAQDSEMLGFEIQRMQNSIRQIKIERDGFDDSAKNLKALNEYLEQEKVRLEEDITAWEKENEELKHAKLAVDENILRLQLELESQGTARSAEAEQRNEFIKLRRQNTDYKRKVNEHEEEMEELRKRVHLLEGELRENERRVKDQHDENGRPVSNGGSPSYLPRSISRSNSKINPMSSSPSREVNELREKVKQLETVVDSKAAVVETLKRDFSAKESILYKKIELLEGANEQLVRGGPDLGLDQLQMELTRLQTLNAVLARRERELVSQLGAQDVLHKEVQRLQEENEQLENRFVRFRDTAKFGNVMERVMALETELAEALESNAMYKMQLRNAFAKQHNVQAAALHDYGDVDQIIGDLAKLKKQASKSEDDVKDLRERYTTMSLLYAEVSAQKEELAMTVRNMRNGRRV